LRRKDKMAKVTVDIKISVVMDADDEGYLNEGQEKQLDDICCDIVDLVAMQDFNVINDEWDIIG
jgi:hypothetical protein